MERIFFPLSAFAILVMLSKIVYAQPAFDISQNVYRLPYENGKVFNVKSDQYTHDPLGRFDLRASGTDSAAREDSPHVRCRTPCGIGCSDSSEMP